MIQSSSCPNGWPASPSDPEVPSDQSEQLFTVFNPDFPDPVQILVVSIGRTSPDSSVDMGASKKGGPLPRGLMLNKAAKFSATSVRSERTTDPRLVSGTERAVLNAEVSRPGRFPVDRHVRRQVAGALELPGRDGSVRRVLEELLGSVPGEEIRCPEIVRGEVVAHATENGVAVRGPRQARRKQTAG